MLLFLRENLVLQVAVVSAHNTSCIADERDRITHARRAGFEGLFAQKSTISPRNILI
jgi:hypothetical protein